MGDAGALALDQDRPRLLRRGSQAEVGELLDHRAHVAPLAHDDPGLARDDLGLEGEGEAPHAGGLHGRGRAPLLHRKGALAHDRLEVADRDPRDLLDEPAQPRQHLQAHARVDAVEDAQRRGDLVQGGVAGAVAEAVDRHVQADGAGVVGREHVGRRQAEVVVAVHVDLQPAPLAHLAHQEPDGRRPRHAVAVDDRDRRGARRFGRQDRFFDLVEGRAHGLRA